MKRFFCWITMTLLICTGVSFVAEAAPGDLPGTSARTPGEQDAFSVAAADFLSSDDAYFAYPVSRNGTDGLLHWRDYGGTLRANVTVPASGDYCLSFVYMALPSKSDFIQLNFSIKSGGQQESEQASILLERALRLGDITQDEVGNDIRARYAIDEILTKRVFRRYGALQNDPEVFHLQAGEAEITIDGLRTDFLLERLIFTPADGVLDGYEIEETPQSRSFEPAKSGAKVQAENILRVSHSLLTAQYDRSDAAVEPSDPAHMTLNIAGGSNWLEDGQWMGWEIEVPEDGLYALRFKARQNVKNGISVNRRLYIDGDIPCLEAYNISFPYSLGWQITELATAEGETVRLPLSKGVHTIRLEIVPGPQADAIRAISTLLADLNEMYRKIIMITGTSPDMNRDYDLERDIPGLTERMSETADKLAAQKASLSRDDGAQNGELAILTTLSSQLASFVREPETIAARVLIFKANIDSLGTWLLTVSEQPLDLDWIELAPPDETAEAAKAGFFENLIFKAQTFAASFSDAEQSGDEDANTLEVWVGMGRDQMQIIKQLCDDRFTPETGIKVRFSVVNQGVNEAILAGNGPDVMLYAPRSGSTSYVPGAEPINLAMRGLLTPLDGKEGFDEIRSEIQSNAFVPYEYRDHAFAMPLTQMYSMLFYRKDIFEELGIECPDTWEELYAVIPIIQRRNMQVGISASEVTYATMLFQNGSSFYNADHTATNFGNALSVDVFTQYTRLYSDYGLPLTFDFFNRFRSGEMPLAIVDYTEYNRLATAAPEIAGLWEMAPIPGTPTASGEIDRSVCATTGQSGYILADSELQEDAWTFLRWFSGAETQADFGRGIEGQLGAVGRYAPANQKAFDSLPWLAAESDLLKGQWAFAMENPAPPGFYYTQRNLNNAFRHVVIDGENAREMLEKYGDEIDRELIRKHEEYLDIEIE